MTHKPAVDSLEPCPFCGKCDLDQWPCADLDGSGANAIRCAWCHGAAPAKTWNRRAPQAVSQGDAAMVERATMLLLGHELDRAPGVNWRCDRHWTVNLVRERMRVVIAALTRPPGGSERLLRKIRDLLDSRPVDCLGEGCNGEINWPVRDEVIDDISKALARVRHSCETDMLSDCPACSADADAAIANDGAQGAEQRQGAYCDACEQMVTEPCQSADCSTPEQVSRAADWRGAVINALVVGHVYKNEHAHDPHKALNALLQYQWDLALSETPATPRPEQAASQGDAVELVQGLIAQWTQQADQCEADAKRLGEGMVSRELIRDAAQYRQTVYQGGLILAALASPTGVQAAQVSVDDVWAIVAPDIRQEARGRIYERLQMAYINAQPGSAAHGGEVSDA